MNTLALSFRALRRDWASGELRVLAIALVIAVASVSSVGFFTDRIKISMERNAAELLAADLVARSHRPFADALQAEAGVRGLATAQTWSFRSVVLSGDGSQLAEVKAVTESYPLRGQLETAETLFGVEVAAGGVPTPGHVWLEPRLAQILGVGPGDPVTVGVAELPVERLLTFEPDRGGEMFNIAPRLMMNLADVEATGLVQPGSHVHYRLLTAGDPDSVASYRDWLLGQLDSDESIQGLQDARPEMRTALQRAEQFLGLAALVSVVLAGVAIALAARRFAMRHWDGVAVMRCLGATQATVLRLYLVEMLVMALAAGLVGVVIGFLAQDLLARLVGSLVVDALPWPSAAPLWPALAVGFVALLGFGLPPILRLREVAPIRVLRRDVSGWQGRPVGLYLAALAAIAGLMLWQAGDARLALWVMGGTLATLLALGGSAWALVQGMGRLRGRAGVAWRFGLANISRRGLGSVAQVVALGLGIMVLLMLTLVRTDLLQSWQSKLPDDAPNYFLINIQQSQVGELEAFLRERGIRNVGLYPMVRGRLTHINDQPVVPSSYTNPRAERLASREFNLSWASRPQADNRIVEGRWWDEQATDIAPEISIEEGIAETLGIRLGDRLRYNLAGTVVDAPVTSLRTVQWDSFRPNFFVVFPPGVLEPFPSNWITSFHLKGDRHAVLSELVRDFPTVTVLDVDALITKVREIMERVVLAVEYVFAFTLLAGVVVLYAAVQATRDERMRESALLRTLGAPRRTVLRSLVAEFAALGALAGVLAALAASLMGVALGQFVFGFGYALDPLLWLLGALAGVLGVVGAGLAATRGVLDQPPMQVLRAEG